MASRGEQCRITPREVLFTIIFGNARENDRGEGALTLETAPENEGPADGAAVELRDSYHLERAMSLRARGDLRGGRGDVAQAGGGNPAGGGFSRRLRIARQGKLLAGEERQDRVVSRVGGAPHPAVREAPLRAQRGHRGG